MTPSVVQTILQVCAFGGKGHPEWISYQNQLERKFACNEPAKMAVPLAAILRALCSNSALETLLRVGESLGIDNLWPDVTLHGGGIHLYPIGGYLGTHLDYARHPYLEGMERRLNVVLFLNQIWSEEWGGDLRLYQDDGETVARRYFPQFNRAVIWEPTDVAYHGCGVNRGPIPRITAAVYYIAPARSGAVRKRALFVPPRKEIA